jgi:hypothetical protein
VLDIPEDVEQRQCRQHDVVGADLEQPAGDVGVHVELEVGQLGALGQAGGAGGVDDRGRVRRIARAQRQRFAHRRGEIGERPPGEARPVAHHEQVGDTGLGGALRLRAG